MNMLCGTSSLPYLPVLPLPDRYAQQGACPSPLFIVRARLTPHLVVATVVWGDLTRDPFQPWNKGTCPADGGISVRILPAPWSIACDANANRAVHISRG